MDAHEHVLGAVDVALHERDVRLAGQLLAERDRRELAELGRQPHGGAALDELLVAAAVLDEVGDGDHLQPVPLAVRRRGRATRAIVPSSFMISQTTPDGLSPARRARSTAASVWPMRSSTPPGFARSGKTCPGCTRSCARRVGMDRDLDRVAAVGGGDAGRHAFARLDRDGERRAERRLVVVGHRPQAELGRRAPRSGRGRSARARASP